MIVTELVRENRPQLTDRERLEQRQPEAHDWSAPEPHHTAARSDPGVHVGDEIDLLWHRLTGGDGDLPDEAKQTALPGGGERRARRLESVTPRQDGREDHQGADDAERQGLEQQAVRMGGHDVGDVQQQAGDADGQQVEADHQGDGEAGACCEGR